MLSFKDWVKHAVSSGGSGALTLGSASSGYQAFAAGDDAKLFPYSIQDGTAWETGYGTYTHSGTSFARTARTASSTGSALTVSTSAFLWVDLVSNIASGMMIGAQGVRPGGRLTLTSGVPVTTSDVTGATSVYYTPYLSNVISLWDGNLWIPVEFTEQTLALGTVITLTPYDVFGFLSSGTLAIEKLVWTNGTTRATAITLQDGRYCKSGDKTRLYLGTFYTSSTTTTEDSGGGVTTQVGGNRLLFNMYNRVRRAARVIDTTDSWSYTTDTIRSANGSIANRVYAFMGLVEDTVEVRALGIVFLNSNSSNAAKVGVGINATNAFSGFVQGGYTNNAQMYAPVTGTYIGLPTLGLSYYQWCEKGGDGTACVFLGDNGADSQQAGLAGVFLM